MPPHRRTESLYRIKWFWQCGELLSLRGRSPWQSPGTHYESVHCSRRLPRPCGLAMTWKLLAGSPGLGGAVVQADRRGRCRPPYREEMKKSPEPSGSRDESLIRGTTLLAAFAASSGSDKPYPGNGGTRVPLLRPRPFTEPTQEPDLRVLRTGSHRPPALCSIGTGKIFPSMCRKHEN